MALGENLAAQVQRVPKVRIGVVRFAPRGGNSPQLTQRHAGTRERSHSARILKKPETGSNNRRPSSV